MRHLLVVLWVLAFTAPSLNSAMKHPCPIGCRDTTHAGPTLDLAGFEVWRHRQSPTWVAKHDSMTASPAVWTRYWPAVRSEAAWLLATTRPAAPTDAGQPFSITLPDTMARGWFYAVVSLDTVGNRACISNELWR